MALSVLQLAAAMRQGDGVTELVEPLLSIITRLQGVGEATVNLLAPDAPAAIKDEAIIRYASYLYDTPSGTSGDRYAASWRNSGAGALVAGWVIRRVADAEAIAQGGGGVSETRISELIAAALVIHTNIVAAHHTPGTGGVIDEAAVRQIIVDSLSAGNSRGAEFASTPTLPTVATTGGIDVDFIIGASAPTGVAVDGNLTRLPHLRPALDLIGVWAVALVDGVESDEVFIPWGGGGIEEEADSIREYAYHGLAFVLPGGSGDLYLDVVVSHRRGAFWTLNLEGDGDTLPADSTVKFYLAVAGVTVQAGEGGGSLDTEAVKALIQPWAQVGNDDLIPAAKYRAPTTTTRGAAFAAATDDVDENPGARLTTFLSYTVTQLKRFTARVVRPFALDGGRLILPSDLLATVTNSRLVKIGATGLFELVAEAPGSPGEPIVDVVGGRLPAAAVAMRLGWSQSRTFIEGTFTRANSHPADGAADGTTMGLSVPPFPPGIASDPSLYLGIWIAGDPDVQAIDRSGQIDGEDSLDFFPPADRQALTVSSVDGYYYPASSREFPPSDDVLSVTLGGGPLIALASDLAALQLEVDAAGEHGTRRCYRAAVRVAWPGYQLHRPFGES